jgi:diguanylate cyclase (GGDEF)-like protein
MDDDRPRVLRRSRHVLAVPAFLLALLVSLPWLLGLVLDETPDATPYLREVLSSSIILLLGGWIFTLIAREQRVARRHLEQLEALTLTDPLTGLGNRRMFERDLDLRLRHASRVGEAIALLYMDVDGLKALNDDYGHACGDETLRILGGVIRSNSRVGSDTAYRVGGDEFVMILSTEGNGAATLAHRVSLAFTERSPKSSRLSHGVMVWDGEVTAGRLLDQADTRMYRHKQRVAVQGLAEAGAAQR